MNLKRDLKHDALGACFDTQDFIWHLFVLFVEINATGFNYQNEDEKVTLSFPSTLQKGKLGASVGFPSFLNHFFSLQEEQIFSPIVAE